MKVILKTCMAGPDGCYRAGDVVDDPDGALVAGDYAEPEESHDEEKPKKRGGGK